jgi:enoyl-[acyl-carrier protein] reductase II
MQFVSNRVTRLLGIKYPIIQAGMVWASGWRLASAVSQAGAFGLLGSGSMRAEILEEHIRKCRAATDKPFGVNLPLIHPEVKSLVDVLIREKISFVFTSAGNPLTWTGMLRSQGMKVIHVVSSSKMARKAEESGCDGVVAEGFEAGGHNGREETATMVLLPAVCKTVKIPVISAGGLATGRQMLAAMILGAEGVQMGTRFVASEEASSHQQFKEAVVRAAEGDSALTLKQLVPVRLLKNNFWNQVEQAQKRGASPDELRELLGTGRAKRGMFEGNLEEGELEIGQVSSLLDEILPAGRIVEKIWSEFSEAVSAPWSYA